MENSASLAIKSAVEGITSEEIERHMQIGDLSKMSDSDRSRHYIATCASVGLNPLTKPFILMRNQAGELFLYAGKSACEQLRKRDRVSIRIVSRERDAENFTVIAAASTPDGRLEESMAVVAIKGLTGQALGNAMMRAETKSKMRATLSITGLGFSSVDDAGPRATEVRFDPRTGEVNGPRTAGLTYEDGARLAIQSARWTPAGEAIDALLEEGGVITPEAQEAQWAKWLSTYREFTPGVLGLLRDKLMARLQDKVATATATDAEMGPDDAEDLPY